MQEFNLSSHKSPRFDINGHPSRPFTVSSSSLTPPIHWSNSASTKTRSELLLKRKQEFIPDITYDIDGDGFVDHKDMAIAKMFDRNKDGILDESEKAEMQKALKEGIMDKFIWGLDLTGANKHPRLIQKKGKIITESGNFLPQTAEPKTYRALKQAEKLEDQHRAEQIINNWIENHPNQLVLTQRPVNSESRFKTWTAKKELEKKEARTNAGLESPSDVKDVKEVKFLYQHQPKVAGFSEFQAKRRQEMVSFK
jgi:hypothetical protein